MNIQAQKENNEKTVRAYSRQFHNLYLFITEHCQLCCEHCYMGDRLVNSESMSFMKATWIMDYIRRLGAQFITFVGGEPTLHPDLPRLVDYALNIGYSKVMLDSNGLFIEPIKKIQPNKLHYIRISLDGASALTHDKVRGVGSFSKTIFGIRELVNLGYRVRITSTVFQFSLHEADAVLALADDLGIGLVNFHTFSEEGNGLKHSEWSLKPEEWIFYYENLEKIKGNYKTRVRYPPTWTTCKKIDYYVNKGFRGCLGCSLDRISIFPDGRCYACSVMLDSKANFGFVTDKGLILNKGENEFELFINSSLKVNESWKGGCPAEEYLAQDNTVITSNKFISVCRLWRVEL